MIRLGRRLPWIVTVALVVGLGISQLVLTVGDWHLRDAGAYWDAAMRLRDGEPLYPPLRESEASEVYRYAPWFAYAWIPFTHLPREVANVLWSAVLIGSSLAALVPLARSKAWLLVALFAPILIGISAIGNVQPLIIAALVLGVERRSGPLWIALAASLKVVPLLLALTYLGRGEWRKAILTGFLTVALVAPMILFDLSNYPTDAGAAAGLIAAPVLYAIAVAAAILVSLRLARTRYAWLASSAAAALAVPRLFVYDITFLMVAIPDGGDPERKATAPREDGATT